MEVFTQEVKVVYLSNNDSAVLLKVCDSRRDVPTRTGLQVQGGDTGKNKILLLPDE